MMNRQRAIRLFAAASTAAILLVSGFARADVRTGDRAAEFVRVVDSRGKRVRLKSYRKQVVVLTFGASWCKPCKKELPALEKVARRYKGKKVVFLAINIDSTKAKGKKFMKQVGVKAIRALFDPKKSTVEAYDPPTMPSTFIISRGIVKHVHAGFEGGDERKIAKLIDRELAKL